jgi:hypothetical protein
MFSMSLESIALRKALQQGLCPDPQPHDAKLRDSVSKLWILAGHATDSRIRPGVTTTSATPATDHALEYRWHRLLIGKRQILRIVIDVMPAFGATDFHQDFGLA